MREYHYIDAAGQQCGPYPLHELKAYPISKTTMVWTTGMADWVEAQTVSDLNFLFDAAAQQAPQSSPTQTAGQPYQQAGGYNYNNQRGVLDGAMPMPKNWLVESILVTLFCCLPFGIAGILSASKVESLYRIGDFEGATRASNDAKKWIKFGFFGGLVVVILYIIYMVAIVGMAASGMY